MSVNMADEDVLLRNELYYCTHLLNESICKDERKFLELIEELEEFSICRETGKDIADYLRDNAIKDENESVNRTYLVRDVDTDELVGFFSLKNGMAIFPDTSGNIITKPSIELSEFAMNEGYLENNPYRKGNGVIIFSDFIIPICKK